MRTDATCQEDRVQGPELRLQAAVCRDHPEASQGTMFRSAVRLPILTHFKRTPYASNTFFKEDIPVRILLHVTWTR